MTTYNIYEFEEKLRVAVEEASAAACKEFVRSTVERIAELGKELEDARDWRALLLIARPNNALMAAADGIWPALIAGYKDARVEEGVCLVALKAVECFQALENGLGALAWIEAERIKAAFGIE